MGSLYRDTSKPFIGKSERRNVDRYYNVLNSRYILSYRIYIKTQGDIIHLDGVRKFSDVLQYDLLT